MREGHSQGQTRKQKSIGGGGAALCDWIGDLKNDDVWFGLVMAKILLALVNEMTAGLA